MKKTLSNTLTFVSLISLVLLLSACQKQDLAQPQAASAEAPPPPPPPVETADVLSQQVELWEIFTGRLESAETVELRPRVSGYIEDVLFKEGSFVMQGDLLFKIDDEPFKAEVRRLEAELKSARAQIALAERDVERAASLKQTNAISQEQLDNRNTQLIKAIADADSIEAALHNANLNLGYTRVLAPISGRISRANITQGNYVGQGATVLTNLVATNVIHAYFDVDENTYVRLRNQALDKRESQLGAQAELQLVGEKGFPHKGKIDFIDNQVDPLTGTIRVRASFANEQSILTPGMFARIRMQVGAPFEAIMVDEQVISTDLSNKYVRLVNAQQIIEYRPVTLGERQGNLRIITSGLTKGDEIVVKSLHMAMPGMPVSPQKVDMLSLNESSSAK
jgi:multidrug efflux system membrane fusion protein